jgi:hypothetical protein
MVGTAITAFIVFWLGVRFVFGPVIADDQPGDPLLAPWLALAIVAIIYVFLLDWAATATGNAVKAALVIALSQIVLVDIYYPLIGRRGWAAAGASIAVIFVGWFIVGTVYGKLSGGGGTGSGGA